LRDVLVRPEQNAPRRFAGFAYPAINSRAPSDFVNAGLYDVALDVSAMNGTRTLFRRAFRQALA